ncbi:VOC family protein [Patulibacter defluvii]|uniref:VOC family protein n=1 Tax=Patulibacter defluvii TaxID=3095358 RepID=UPI002A762BF8|nr:VOC family protein [Patulibacter sp. DM4]
MNATLQIDVVLLGVADLDRAKRFYGEGMGGEIEQDVPGFARLRLGAGSTSLALVDRETAAQDAGVAADGSGFRAVSLHVIVDSRAQVDELLGAAEAAGATLVKPPTAAQWGGYDGWFGDPDGHLWKVATSA